MSELLTKPQSFRNFHWEVPITACQLSRDDLKRIYRIIDSKQIEERDRFLRDVIRRQPQETDDQFSIRRERVTDAHLTAITVTGTSGEKISGFGEDFLDSSILPERIASIYYDTKSTPTGWLNLTPANWASVLLDFTRPPIINWHPTPSSPTPNNSTYTVYALNEAWGTSLNAQLARLFLERKRPWDWLHRQGAYDALVIFLGIPLALWASARLGGLLFNGLPLPSAVSIGAYVYLFIATLNVFRAIFSYSRWVFPKVELVTGSPSGMAKHRALLWAIIVGLIGRVVWDLIHAVW